MRLNFFNKIKIRSNFSGKLESEELIATGNGNMLIFSLTENGGLYLNHKDVYNNETKDKIILELEDLRDIIQRINKLSIVKNKKS